VVLDEPKGAVRIAPPFGHIAFLAAQPGEARDAPVEAFARAELPHVSGGARRLPLLQQLVETGRAETPPRRLEKLERERRVAVGEAGMALVRQRPDPFRAPDALPPVRMADEVARLELPEMLPDGDRGDAETARDRRRRLRAARFQRVEDPFRASCRPEVSLDDGASPSRSFASATLARVAEFEKQLLSKFASDRGNPMSALFPEKAR
jgi:hypothetical protein